MGFKSSTRLRWFSLESIGALLRRHPADDTTGRAIRKITRADLICIDDIGLLPLTTETAEVLYRVVDAAYERRARDEGPAPFGLFMIRVRPNGGQGFSGNETLVKPEIGMVRALHRPDRRIRMFPVRSPFRSRRSGVLAAAALAAACLASLLNAPSASAVIYEQPDYRLVNSINNRLSYMYLYERGLYDANFHHIVNDTGIVGPDATEDAQRRKGARAEYRGWNDRGVVIAHWRYDDGTASATWIYGAILAAWERTGAERGVIGWPLGPEHTATAYALARGCAPGDRAQTFEAATTTAVACWNPSSGVTWHRFWR